MTIYRGEAQIAQVKLTGKTMTLGRGKDNDVVLEDPGKGVSRVHAELRAEGDRYRLVDLQSQNGIWVSGERVPSVVLTPGVVAAMGPFRVAVDAASPLTQPFTPIREAETGTEFNLPVTPAPPPPAPSPEPVAVDGAGSLLEDLAATPGATLPLPKAAPPLAAAPARPAPPAAPARGPAPGPRGQSRTPMILIAAVLVLGVLGFGVYKLMHKPAPGPAPGWDGAAAAAMVDSGRCQEALDQQINRALAANPNDAEALRLKARCSAPPPAPAEPVPDPQVVASVGAAEKLDAAEASFQASQCQAALDTANEVLAADATNERATDLAKRASDCLKAATRRPATAPPADPVVRIAPSQGGLEPVSGETGKDYRARVASVRKRYDDAASLLQAQRYQQAMKEFDGIAGQVPTGYLDLAQRRTEARSGMR
ncbi:MAG: FHA domain-containing protein, partial [Acidobacteriota bacterium]